MNHLIRKQVYIYILSMIIFSSFSSLSAEESDFDEFEETTSAGGSNSIDFSGSITLEQGVNTTGAGVRQSHGANENWTLANRRFRLKTNKTYNEASFYSKIDFNFNDIEENQNLDIRELRIKYTPFAWMDVSVGRQVSTWGVGDMLYINDLFPKNWVSNFQGRENEMLKDSSNSIRVTNYIAEDISWDIVYHPKFSADTTPNGEYFTVFDPNTKSLVNAKKIVSTSDVSNHIEDGEVASQFKWTIFEQEMALYLYHGFYKNPKSLQMVSNKLLPLYSRLNVYGLSSEGQIGPGIFSFETGYNESLDDKNGTNALIENSSMKYLVGYKIDLSAKFSIGTQFFLEQTLDYDGHKNNLQGDDLKFRKKELQKTYTIRLTYKAMQETLWYNVFAYIRPDHHDSYTKIDIEKKINNQLKLGFGANIFTGNNDYKSSEFGMLQNDDNLYVRLRLDF